MDCEEGTPKPKKSGLREGGGRAFTKLFCLLACPTPYFPPDWALGLGLALGLAFFAAFAAALGGLTANATQCLADPYWFLRRRKKWSRVAFLSLNMWRTLTVPPVGAGISLALYLWSLPTPG